MLISHSFFSPFRTSARGLEAQRIAMGVAAENIANANTSRTADGGPYAPKRAVHELEEPAYDRFADLLSQVRTRPMARDGRHFEGLSLRRRLQQAEMGPLTAVDELPERVRTEYDPSHPHADEQGYVTYPDINVVEEMARMISANRIYEANLTAVQATKDMIKRTLEI
ncbi:MAG: flagellar basal body rod protein FlgC [Bacteroidetes bacterium]|nr:flagellar basal body rod protein FlgC [Rhodothermaceae bacterium RA]RMH55109.1 MAG: flagellar basal body rod protein FlgC [Bacteroidota bacterium]